MMYGQTCFAFHMRDRHWMRTFHIRKEDYFRENGGIVFPNPNAPTGVEMPLEEVEDIIRHNPDVIVIVDEAYVDFWWSVGASID